jgi:hypothetical protein
MTSSDHPDEKSTPTEEINCICERCVWTERSLNRRESVWGIWRESRGPRGQEATAQLLQNVLQFLRNLKTFWLLLLLFYWSFCLQSLASLCTQNCLCFFCCEQQAGHSFSGSGPTAYMPRPNLNEVLQGVHLHVSIESSLGSFQIGTDLLVPFSGFC